jgi:hypothetical protein
MYSLIIASEFTIIRAIDDGGSKDLWNVGERLPDYTAQYPKRQFILKKNMLLDQTSNWMFFIDSLLGYNDIFVTKYVSVDRLMVNGRSVNIHNR